MIYGYVRVSTKDQNPERQITKMRELGVDELFVDKASGKDLDRPEYQRLMNLVASGDKIILDSLDRLGRNYDDVTGEWRRLTSLGVDLQCLDLDCMSSENLRGMGAIGKVVEDMILSLLSYVAQAEREKNKQRQAEGIAIAKAEGKYRGRSCTDYTQEILEQANQALKAEGKGAAARILGVTRGTVYNMIKDGRLAC